MLPDLAEAALAALFDSCEERVGLGFFYVRTFGFGLACDYGFFLFGVMVLLATGVGFFLGFRFRLRIWFWLWWAFWFGLFINLWM